MFHLKKSNRVIRSSESRRKFSRLTVRSQDCLCARFTQVILSRDLISPFVVEFHFFDDECEFVVPLVFLEIVSLSFFQNYVTLAPRDVRFRISFDDGLPCERLSNVRSNVLQFLDFGTQ